MQSLSTEPVHADDAEYSAYMHTLQKRFTFNMAKPSDRLFKTDATDLFAAYLAAFPEAECQHHNCNACRRFINSFGSLVTIAEDGTATSPFWNVDDAPDIYKAPIAAILSGLRGSKVTGVFLTNERVWGQPRTGDWAHFAVTPPMALVHQDRTKTANQTAAEKREDRTLLLRALSEFTPATISQAVALLKSNTLYRGDRVLGVAEWFLKLSEEMGLPRTDLRDNRQWRAVALAPAGYAHVRGSMIGTLLEDITNGLKFEDVAARFAAKMAAGVYQHAQAAPTERAIAVAEKLVAELGLAPSLQRRYAQLAELQTIWKPQALKAKPSDLADAAGAVFAHIKPKTATPATAALDIPANTMTWDKFKRTVLADAITIEAAVPASSTRFMALVTALHADAPPILQWDREDARNPVSWYYAAGIDGEMKRRVTEAGGQYENVDIRASLLWDNFNDLDLHVWGPSGEYINFSNKRPLPNGGWLDVDMNAPSAPKTNTPVENVRWAKGTAKQGGYRVMVHNYANRVGARLTPFRLELEVGGEIFQYEGSVGATGDSVVVADFRYTPGHALDNPPGRNMYCSVGGVNAWGLTTGQFVPVTGIVLSPNLWGDKPLAHLGQHTFFTLEGCKDANQGIGRGFFTETLRGELREVRSTLEAYAKSAVIEGADTATACGLGMSDQAAWDLLLRVKTPVGTQTYKIDRWD